MKKIFLIFCFLFLPLHVFADVEVFLSSDNLPYSSSTWTSAHSPDPDSSKISVIPQYYREEMPSGISFSQQEISDFIMNLFSELSQSEKNARYTKFSNFSSQNLDQYIAFALSPNSENDIAQKISLGYTLTPFESTFQNCGINLTQRQAITKTLIQNIYNDTYSNVDSLKYSDIRFGDCIIPFPDVRRGSNAPADSFPSNIMIAQYKSGNYLDFGSLEDSVHLLSLSDLHLSAVYEQIEENNLLELSSTRVNTGSIFSKMPGKNKILFVHQNEKINPFADEMISGNLSSGYKISGVSFSPTNEKFIQSSDDVERRTFENWENVEPGIYKKTVLQENTFTLSGGVYIPRQSVGASTYYAIIYNYDTSAPVCGEAFYSGDAVGTDNFIFPEYPWFHEIKYGYFLCSDDESECSCDESAGCIKKGNYIFSASKKISHNNVFNIDIKNVAGLGTGCVSPDEEKLFYDKKTPNIALNFPGIPGSLQQEYVTNQGVVYDGVQMQDKKYYQILNNFSFSASGSLGMKLQFVDPYMSGDTSQGVSGLSSVIVSISQEISGNWQQKIFTQKDFPVYNPQATKTVKDIYTLDFDSLEGISDVTTQIGAYQVFVIATDAAGNQTRLVYYFSILPGPISISQSTLSTPVRNSLFADNSSEYTYTLSLKDAYGNVISGKQITSIDQVCSGVTDCKVLRSDMTGITPSGQQAIHIVPINSTSNNQGQISFKVSSFSPGTFTERFQINFVNPNASRIFLGVQNSFLKPLTGILEVQINGSWVSDQLPVGEQKNYRVKVENNSGVPISFSLGDFSSYIHARHPQTSFALSGTLIQNANGKNFAGTFESFLSPEEAHKTLLEISSNGLSPIKVSSVFSNGNSSQYFLASDSSSNDPLILTDTRELNTPVKIIGDLQAVGNTHNANEVQNITDLDTLDQRNTMRKNIGETIKNIPSGTVTSGGIKFVDKTNDTNKNYILESNPNFKTLIVKNGNILIQNDFNTSQKNVGIISYIDGGYNVESGYNSVGNIFVQPNVAKIYAFIYADGGLISFQSGNPISSDREIRKNTLGNQLSIIGSLFSRNTLAGSNMLGGKYVLPGGEISSDENLAIQYDLYFVRRGNQGCEQDIYGFCNIPQYLIVDYNTEVNLDPPPLFSN